MSAAAAVARVVELDAMIGRVAGKPATGGAAFSAQLAAAQAGPAPVATTAASTPFAGEIDAAAARHGLDPALLRGLIRAESGFNPAAGSPAGAQGLTQLMPATARSLGVSDPFDPVQSIEGGARYLRQQLDRFGGDERLALAAYNAGPGAVQRFGGVPPYAETRSYVERVLGFAAQYRGAPVATPAPSGVAAAPALPPSTSLPYSVI